MTQYNFTTNIEHRMPGTGKIFCIDRMTSDYAEQHPLDVEGFIESVYQEFAGTKFEESRESLRSIWTAVLSVKSPRGDASLYPNKNGAKRAAAMKVWLCAGEYWRHGFRHGDTLPDMVPMCKITRIAGGWIALFPKDKHLLNPVQSDLSLELCSLATEGTQESDCDEYKDLQSERITNANTPCDGIANPAEQVETELVAQPSIHRAEPRQLDLFAQLQQENEALQARIAELERQEQQRREQEERDRAERFAREEQERRDREEAERKAHEEQVRRAEEEARNRAERFAREEQQPREHQRSDVPEWKRKLEEQWLVNHPYESSHAVAATTPAASASGSDHAWLKTAGYIAAASIALLLIWQTGLIIPLGLIGLATSGLLK